MTKYLLLIGLVWVLWWSWRKSRASLRAAAKPQTFEREAEGMVQCARCGVNQPVSESLLSRGRYYCCAAHLGDSASDDL